MLTLFIIMLGSPISSPPARITATAEARILILHAHRASAREWGMQEARHKREVVRQEKEGRIQLRLTEFE